MKIAKQPHGINELTWLIFYTLWTHTHTHTSSSFWTTFIAISIAMSIPFKNHSEFHRWLGRWWHGFPDFQLLILHVLFAYLCALHSISPFVLYIPSLPFTPSVSIRRYINFNYFIFNWNVQNLFSQSQIINSILHKAKWVAEFAHKKGRAESFQKKIKQQHNAFWGFIFVRMERRIIELCQNRHNSCEFHPKHAHGTNIYN